MINSKVFAFVNDTTTDFLRDRMRLTGGQMNNAPFIPNRVKTGKPNYFTAQAVWSWYLARYISSYSPISFNAASTIARGHDVYGVNLTDIHMKGNAVGLFVYYQEKPENGKPNEDGFFKSSYSTRSLQSDEIDWGVEKLTTGLLIEDCNTFIFHLGPVYQSFLKRLENLRLCLFIGSDNEVDIDTIANYQDAKND